MNFELSQSWAVVCSMTVVNEDYVFDAENTIVTLPFILYMVYLNIYICIKTMHNISLCNSTQSYLFHDFHCYQLQTFAH